MADIIAIGLRGLAFAAALQAAGVSIFATLFGNDLDRASRRIRTIVVMAAMAGLALTILHAVVAPVRLTGEMRTVFDGSLQRVLLTSDIGTATAVRVLGLGMILAGSLWPGRLGSAASPIGASLTAASFAFMGHTAAGDQRWLLAPMLIVHLLIAAFWLGALWPLLAVMRREDAGTSGAIIERFSSVAIWVVPIVFLAGVAMAVALLPGLSSLWTPYGLLLMTKVAGFTILIGLGAMNKWRFGPRVARGDRQAARAFRRTVVAEWYLIVSVVMVTAAMTALFSPQH